MGMGPSPLPVPMHIVYVNEKDGHVLALLSKKTKGIEVSLSRNVERRFKLNQTTLSVYGLPKG